MNIAIYTRVSTLHQVEDGLSLNAQKQKLTEIAKYNNYKIYKIYEELGKSGKNTNRPAFQEMMSDMRQHKFEKILVMKLDRISRSVSDLEIIIKELQENNIGFESASEKIDTASSMGMLFVRLLGVFAQFERERISERVKDVFEEKKRKKEYLGGNICPGFTVEDNQIIVDKEKSKDIKKIFEIFNQTRSLAETTRFINNNFDWLGNGKCTPQRVKRILTSDKYINNYVDIDEYIKIQDILKNKQTKNSQYDYLFKHLIYGKCGHVYYSRCMKGKRCYYCSTVSKKHHKLVFKNNETVSCKCSYIYEDKLEKDIIKILPIKINEFLENNKIKSKTIDTDEITKKINKHNSEKSRLVNSYNKGWMTLEDVEKEINEINNQLNYLNTLLEQQKPSKFLSLPNDWLIYYKELNQSEKAIFYTHLIERIEVDIDNYKKGKDYITIYFNK